MDTNRALQEYGFYLGPKTEEVRCPDPMCMEDPDEEIMVKWGETCWSCQIEMPPRVNISEFPCLNPLCRNKLNVIQTARRAEKLRQRAIAQNTEPQPIICTACGYKAWPNIHKNLYRFISPQSRAIPMAIRELAQDEVSRAFMVVLILLHVSQTKVYSREDWDDLLDNLERNVIAPPTFNGWIKGTWEHPADLLELKPLGAANPAPLTEHAPPTPQPVSSVRPVPTKPTPVENKPIWEFWGSFQLTGSQFLDQIKKASITEEDISILCYDHARIVYNRFDKNTMLQAKLRSLAKYMNNAPNQRAVLQWLANHYPLHFSTPKY